MIYYDIQHHEKVDNLLWLIRLLDHPGNRINVSLDAKQEIVDSLKHQIDKADNVSIVKSIPVTWCGPSQIEQMKAMFEKALDDSEWEYFINLSGACFPLLSQSEILKRLEFEKKQGNTSFCYSFDAKKQAYWVEKKTNSTANFSKKYRRLELLCDSEIMLEFENGEFDPVRNVMQRRALFCEEVGNKKLSVRSLFKDEIHEREGFWKKYDYKIGRTWVVLHRKQVEWLVKSKQFKEVYEHLYKTFEPDETLLPTVLFNKNNPYLNELSKNNFRYKLGSPNIVNPKNIDDILSSDSFFARKLNPDFFKLLVDKIERNLN